MAGLGVALTGLITTIKNLLEDSKVTLRNVVTVLLIIGLEALLEMTMWQCPVHGYYLYGMLYIWGPIICLFNISLLANAGFWDLVTGCYKVHIRKRWICKRMAVNIFESILAPVVWLVNVLVDGKYFVCLCLGPKENALSKATNETQREEINELYAHTQSLSQMYAWIVFISLVIVATIFVLIRRCFILQAATSLPTLDDYGKYEADAAMALFKEKLKDFAKAEGERQVNSLLATTDEITCSYEKIKDAHEFLAKKYPYSTGDPSKPYRRENTDHPVEEIPMLPLTNV